MENMLYILFLLLAGHALGDFALQNQYMADSKNKNTEYGKEVWWMVLTAHSLIHGAIVSIVTGSFLLGIAETIAHWVTDYYRTENKIDYKTDQFLHVVHKFLWFFILIAFGAAQPT